MFFCFFKSIDPEKSQIKRNSRYEKVEKVWSLNNYEVCHLTLTWLPIHALYECIKAYSIKYYN